MAARLQLDDIDRNIIELLRRNGRRTIADIAARVHLSAAPVKRRIERLERVGVIAGYTALIDDGKLAGSVEAFTTLQFAGDVDLCQMLESCLGVPEVCEVFNTAGDVDVLVHVRAHDIEHLKGVINDIRRLPGVTSARTLTVLNSWARANVGPAESNVVRMRHAV